MRLGFVGLGIMGAPMALNLIKGGHDLQVKLPTASAANDAFVRALAAGDGDLDFRALLRTQNN